MAKRLLKWGIVVVGFGALTLVGSWLAPLHSGRAVFEVRSDTTLRDFAEELKSRRVLPSAYTLLLLAHLEHRTRALKAGDYRFPDGITQFGLLTMLAKGRTIQYPVTLIDGWTFKEVMAALARAPHLRHTLSGLTPAQIMQHLGHPGVSAEGAFYPDTYFYTAGVTDASILARAYDRMHVFLAQAWAGRAPELPLKSPEQALILASLVEREAALPAERSLIAGVFFNRLAKHMMLQTDPTVIYAMGSRYHGKIHARDLRRASPYNTYLHYGLPPTPIALPGPEAILAALHPTRTDALYFVAKGDGTHAFSATLKAQDAAVRKYELTPRPKSAPARAPHLPVPRSAS